MRAKAVLPAKNPDDAALIRGEEGWARVPGQLGKSGLQGCSPGPGAQYPLGLGHIICVLMHIFLWQ